MNSRVAAEGPRAIRWCPPGGCRPENRCPVHRDAEPERVGDLAVDVLAALNGGRPRLYLIRGGKR